MENIKTQKIYTYPDRKLYGEFCLLSLLELRVKIAKGEIKEQLCYIDKNDRAYVYDKFGVPEGFSDDFIDTLYGNSLKELLKVQMKILSEEIFPSL